MTPSETTTSPDLAAATVALLAVLDARSKDIVTRRYGLATGTTETLESIGREYGITRERVRQIQSQARRALRDLDETLAPIADMFQAIFAHQGGVLAESHAIELVREQTQTTVLPETIVVFYLDILHPYTYTTRDKDFGPHWNHPEFIMAQAREVVTAAREVLNKHQHPITQETLLLGIRKTLGDAQGAVTDRQILALLRASKHVEQTPFGEWGLVGWPETNPRGVGDKAYAVLRRHGKPSHFTEITQLINEAEFDHKRANPQTVHNELIKDKRFVLVGRGLYGLTEWGYVPGTVADVIESLLAQANTPLTREEVINGVLSQRQVKKNTILLGLQNQDRFTKTPENRYTLRSR